MKVSQLYGAIIAGGMILPSVFLSEYTTTEKEGHKSAPFATTTWEIF
jgi:hypothetical protein